MSGGGGGEISSFTMRVLILYIFLFFSLIQKVSCWACAGLRAAAYIVDRRHNGSVGGQQQS